jgi:hypothetical protein
LCPPTAALQRYRVRIVAESRGQPAMTGSLGTTGRTLVTAIK